MIDGKRCCPKADPKIKIYDQAHIAVGEAFELGQNMFFYWYVPLPAS